MDPPKCTFMYDKYYMVGNTKEENGEKIILLNYC
jgi:hypothetical protein